MNEGRMLPSITVQEVAEKRRAGGSFILLDVREEDELELANLGKGVEHLPLSLIQEKQLNALPPILKDKQKEVIVFCHHGGRSAQVVGWLIANGWKNVKNMSGGIHTYAEEVDGSIGTY